MHTCADLVLYCCMLDICAAAHNCSGHGNCYGTTDDDPGWVCLCDDNWFGPTCEYEGDDVCRAVDYCYGHGSCTYIFNVVVRFNCTCDEGYEPLFECEFLKPTFDRCNFEGCANGGNCTGNLTHFTCDCPAGKVECVVHSSVQDLPSLGFTGLNCSETFDVCSGQCANGGTCSEIADGHYFECSCPPGYTGYRCDQLLPTELPGLECMNDGTVSGDGMECNCLPGFSGQRCEIWDACTTAPCSVNTQHCLSSPDHPPGFVCVCEEGWGGEHCDVDYTQCTVSQGKGRSIGWGRE